MEPEGEEAKTPEPDDGIAWRSVSQLKEYSECPYRFYLHRVKKVWQRPAAWLPQGLAVHEAAEAYELTGRAVDVEDLEEIYTSSYDKHTNRLLQDTMNTAWWFRSGPYGGALDIERRYKIGLEQVGRYVDFYEKYPDQVPLTLPDGSLAVEWPFNVWFAGVPVRGVIDLVLKDGKPRDNKSGNRPGDVVQLATYAGAIEQILGIAPTTGDFWMGKTGKVTYDLDLRDYTQDRLADIYSDLEENIRAERFDPDPEPSKCMFCPVASSCSFAQ